MLRGLGFKIETKPVKFMDLSIDVSGISKDSPGIIKNFIEPCFFRELTVEVIEYLNTYLGVLNAAGKEITGNDEVQFRR